MFRFLPRAKSDIWGGGFLMYFSFIYLFIYLFIYSFIFIVKTVNGLLRVR